MTRKQTLKDMREVLLRRREALRHALEGDDSLLKEMSSQAGGDVVDFASDSQFGELNSQLAEVESRELQEVEAALKKMTGGTYGKCEGCSRNIPLARLQVLPYASYCVNCKRLAEKAGIQPNTVVDWSLIFDAEANGTLNSIDFNIS